MFRCIDRRGWVDHEWETPDPDEVEESLKKLYFGTSGTWLDAFWHLLVDLDPEERLRLRTKQKAYLARYGKQDWFAWEHRETTELDDACREINEIVTGENEGGGGGLEDR